MNTYLLTREPWLPVVTAEGTDRLGLIETFERADTLMVAPGGPLEYRATHRLLLAISYAALGSPAEGAYPRAFDGAKVARWLADHEDDFDLLNPTAPFGQDAALDDDEDHANIVSMANLDTTVARSRPLLTDFRRAADVRSVPLADAVMAMLVYNLFDAPGIHEGVKAVGTVTSKRRRGSNLSMKGTEGGTLAFVPKGMLATTMMWSMVPTRHLGKPCWTYSGPAGAEGEPDGELDALTWLSRRFLLHHNGAGQATGVQIHQGRVKKFPGQKPTPDTIPGQRGFVLSANDPKTTAGTGEIGAPTSAGRGNPLALIERWEAGSAESLSGHVRAALQSNPDLTPPRIVAIGQRLENTALKVSTREVEVPRVEGGLAERAMQIREARRERRLPPDADRGALALLDSDDSDDGQRLEALRVTSGEAKIDWPTHAQRLSGGMNDDGRNTPKGSDTGSLSAVRRIAGQVEMRDGRGDGAGGERLRRLRYRLYRNFDVAAHLASVMAARIPDDGDVQALGVPDLSRTDRLWAGLFAVAVHDWRNAWDDARPLPVALRQAGARLGFNKAQSVLVSMSESPDVGAARPHLMEAVALMAQSSTGFSWWSLADDLENWSPQIRNAWKSAYFTKATTTTEDPNKEEK